MRTTAERWRQIEALYFAAAARPEGERDAFLEVACSGDAELQREVASLLRSPASDGLPAAVGAAALLPTRPALSESPSLEGRQLGSYRIGSRLGAGGMGDVYRAYDQTLHRDVAIKVLRGDDDEEAARGRLLREARAAAALNHSNICTIHEVGEDDGQAFLAMELVDGEPLHRIIPPGIGLPVDRLLDCAVQVADALAHAHGRGVLHRDLKVQNIVITPAGRAKVLDFGLAKRVVSDATASATLSAATAPGTLAGTPAYMAPEQLRGQPADARSDIWALGIVIYEMAAGDRPFSGQTLYELSSSILSAPPPPLPSHVPRELQHLVARCLEKDPAARFQSAAEVRSALEAVKAGRMPLMKPLLTFMRRRLTLATAVSALALASVVALNLGGLRDMWSAQPLFDSVAVLPFMDGSGDEDDAYLASGIHLELTTELAQLPGFTKVISAASTRRLRDPTAPPADIARSLGVRALVTGSVERSGDRVRIAAELIDGADERQVWSHTFDRSARDLYALQTDIATAVAEAVRLRLRPGDRERLASRATIDPATYELYLRGMHELRNVDDGGNSTRGIRFLQDAVDRDPGDPHAYAGLAMGYVALGHSPAAPEDAWIKARAAAERAQTLAPDLASAHTTMGQVKMYYEWDWAGVERAFQRANELNPNLAVNHYHYAWYLYLHGRIDEAIAEHERARDLDPLTPRNTAYLPEIYVAAGRFDEALAMARKAIDAYPRAGVAWQALGYVHSAMGQHEEAIAANQRAAEYAPPWTFALGIAYAKAGRVDEARAVLQKIESRPTTAYNMWARALVRLHLGDADEFFAAIGYSPHHGFAPWVRIEPGITRFKDDPRYAALFARFKLPLPSF